MGQSILEVWLKWRTNSAASNIASNATQIEIKKLPGLLLMLHTDCNSKNSNLASKIGL